MLIITKILAATTSANTWIKVGKEHLESGPRQMCMDILALHYLIILCQADCSSNPCHFLLSLTWFYRPYYHIIIPTTHSFRALCISYLKLANLYHILWLSAQTLWIFLNLYSCVLSNANSLLFSDISLHHHFLAWKRWHSNSEEELIHQWFSV